MNSKRQQSGLTLISWIILIALILFVVWFGVQLFTIYLNYFNINKSMMTVASQVQIGETPQQIRGAIDSLITINEISDVSPKDNVTIGPSPNGNALILTLDYKSQSNFIGNVDLLVHFHRVYTATPH